MPRRRAQREALFDSSPKPAPRDCVTATIDGAARGNPGPAAYGIVFEDARGKRLAQLAGKLGKTTNNVAEYRALLAALAYARRQGWRALRVRTDSELLAQQVRGAFRVRSADLRPLHQKAKELISGLDYFGIEAVPRKLTRPADKLANAALDGRPSYVPQGGTSEGRPVPRKRPATSAQRPAKSGKATLSPVAPLSRAKLRDATGKKKRATGGSLPAGRHGPWPERGRAIRAVYRGGVLKPVAPLDLPDGTEVEMIIHPEE